MQLSEDTDKIFEGKLQKRLSMLLKEDLTNKAPTKSTSLTH